MQRSRYNYGGGEADNCGGGEAYNYGGREPRNYGGREPHNYGGGEPHNYGGGEAYNYGGGEPHNYGGGEPHNYGGREPHNYGGGEAHNYGGGEAHNYGGGEAYNYGGGEPHNYGGGEPHNYGGREPHNYGGGEAHNYGGGEAHNYGGGEAYNHGGGEPASVPRRGDTIIVVMGMTGSGKSSFISQFRTQREVGIGLSLESYTDSVQLYRCRDAELGSFWLIDTPGFNDTYLTDAQVLESIVIWLNAAYRERIELSGILYLHSIQENRVGGSTGRSFHFFRQLTGERALRKVLLVTTFWDLVPVRISRPEAENRQRQLETTDYWGDMIRLGARVARHSNSRESAREVIRTLLSTRSAHDWGTYLEVQEEMSQGRRLEETAVGRQINRYLEEQQQYFNQELENLRRQLQETLQTMADQHRRDLEQQRADFERRSRLLQEDRERMHANMEELDWKVQQLQIDRDEKMAKEEELCQNISQLEEKQRSAKQRNRDRARKLEAEEIIDRYWCNIQ